MPCFGAMLTRETPVHNAALHQKKDKSTQLVSEPRRKGNKETAATPANARLINSVRPKAPRATVVAGALVSALVNKANVVRKT